MLIFGMKPKACFLETDDDFWAFQILFLQLALLVWGLTCLFSQEARGIASYFRGRRFLEKYVALGKRGAFFCFI